MYYVRSRDVEEFDELVELVVADRFKTAISPAEYEHVKIQEGTAWAKSADLADMVSAFEEAKGIGAAVGGGAPPPANNDEQDPPGSGKESPKDGRLKKTGGGFDTHKSNRSGVRCFRCAGPHFARTCSQKRGNGKTDQPPANVARVSIESAGDPTLAVDENPNDRALCNVGPIVQPQLEKNSRLRYN